MASTPTPAPEAIGTVGRMTGVLFSPKETFADIVRRPTWIAPVVVVCVLSIAVVALFGQRVGWRSTIEKQFANNSRIQQMTPEERQAALERGVKAAPYYGYVFSVLGAVIGVLLIAGIYLGMFNGMAGAELNFKAALGIVTHSWMPFVIQGLLAFPVIFLRDPSTIDVNHLVASNLGALLPIDSSKWLMSLGTSLDIFTFWTLYLLAVGFSVSNRKKISVGKALVLVLIPWVFFVCLKMGLAALFT